MKEYKQIYLAPHYGYAHDPESLTDHRNVDVILNNEAASGWYLVGVIPNWTGATNAVLLIMERDKE